MKIKLDDNAIKPVRAHATDAGLDLCTPVSFVINPGESFVVDTGVHIEIPRGYVGMLKSKSGLNVKYGITSEGVIDEGYTGSIVAKLYNHGDLIKGFTRGMKITQLVLVPYIAPEIEFVDALGDTERGDNGFGSTGK